MTLRGASARDAFRNADAYAATMAPSLRTMAHGVVYRAALKPGERVLDVATGTGIGVERAAGEGREVIGLDLSSEMLEIARHELPDHEFVEADYTAIPFPDASFDVVMCVHGLLFADDPVVALREWRRVTRPGGRLSVSVPGPEDRTPMAIYASVYDRHGVEHSRGADYPTQSVLKGWGQEAGWQSVATDADPRTAIRLADEDLFERWLSIGSRAASWAERSADERQALKADLLAATPRESNGALRIPFGAIYLTARAPEG